MISLGATLLVLCSCPSGRRVLWSRPSRKCRYSQRFPNHKFGQERYQCDSQQKCRVEQWAHGVISFGLVHWARNGSASWRHTIQRQANDDNPKVTESRDQMREPGTGPTLLPGNSFWSATYSDRKFKRVPPLHSSDGLPRLLWLPSSSLLLHCIEGRYCVATVSVFRFCVLDFFHFQHILCRVSLLHVCVPSSHDVFVPSLSP